MGATKFIKGAFTFFMLMMTVAINTDKNAITRLGFEPNYLVMTLSAVCITGLIVHRGLALIVSVLVLSISANAPQDFMLNIGVDRDYLLAALVVIILSHLIERIIA